MSKIKFSMFFIATILFLGLGSTTLNAQMKCAPGKCGASMEMPKSCADKKVCDKVKHKKSCGKKDCTCGENCTCGKKCTCGDKKAVMKCAPGKCGAN